MAPRRGGGGGSSSSGGSSSCVNSEGDNYACTDGLFYMYGHWNGPFYSDREIYGQLTLYCIWTLVLIFPFYKSVKHGARFLQLAIACFGSCFTFLCVRLGLLIGQSDVPIEYRYESSIVVLLWRLGMVFLLAAVFQPDTGKLVRIGFWLGLAIYGTLDIAYVVLDFVISSKAVETRKSGASITGWQLADRDFGLTLTHSMMAELEAYESRENFIEWKLYDTLGGTWHRERGVQIKVGVAADFVAFALVGALFIVGALAFWREKTSRGRNYCIIIATSGLLMITVFRLVIANHYILYNWNIMTKNAELLLKSRLQQEYKQRMLGFVAGYRFPVNEFSIVQAAVEPLGVAVACVMISWW